jgi:hypothetical protein
LGHTRNAEHERVQSAPAGMIAVALESDVCTSETSGNSRLSSIR